MQFNCPVCDKAGLQNFRATEITCPQCNTNLKPYVLLSTVSKTTTLRKSYRIILVILGFTTIGLTFWVFTQRSQGTKETSSVHTESTGFYKSEIQKLKEGLKNQNTGADFIFKYRIRNGDNLSKIAKYFYGDWKMHKLIEADNNLVAPYTLNAGQILLIKLKN